MKYFKNQKNSQLGNVYLCKVKRGKENCHCADNKSHTAYYHFYRYKNQNGKTRICKKYVKRADVKKLKQKLQYQRNLNYFPFITGDIFLYSNEQFPDKAYLLAKRLHIIREKADFTSSFLPS